MLQQVSAAVSKLTPCPDSEPQVSTCILNLSVITHHQPSSSSSSNRNKFPKNQTGFDSCDRSPVWIGIKCAGIPKVRKARASPETSVQDPVRRSFLTRMEGSAGPGEIVMPVAATGVQACEWRLVGVARQFEVYCVG